MTTIKGHERFVRHNLGLEFGRFDMYTTALADTCAAIVISLIVISEGSFRWDGVCQRPVSTIPQDAILYWGHGQCCQG